MKNYFEARHVQSHILGEFSMLLQGTGQGKEQEEKGMSLQQR